MILSDEVKQQFIQHAQRDAPREACGLVAVVKGKQRYYECKNIAKGINDFILDPRDYIRIDDLVSHDSGDIVAVVHSHPVSDSRPTMADRVGCETSGLQWDIFSLKTKLWHSFTPSGYVAPLIGRVFKHGVFDCYSALRDWYGQRLNINLPDFERQPEWWKKGDNLLMENFASAGFTEVVDGSIQVGDVFLMNISSVVVNHCAVYIGNDQVFHQMMNRLSSREIYGGWLKKNTRMVLRNKR